MKFLESLIFMLNEMSPYILLGFLIAGLLHAFVPARTMSRHLSGTGFRSVAKAALFGIPLPLCSCGVLPAAVSLRRGGASRAASTSFLVATPQTGVDSIAATYAMLGPAFAVVRPVAALSTALAGGCLVGRFEKGGGADGASECAAAEADEFAGKGFWRRLLGGIRYGFVDMVASIGGWLVVGLVIAALITLLVPDEFFLRFKDYTLLTMLAVVIVAVPMYVCATGSIPIAMSLMLKGLSPGTALVLLMAGPAANFASVTVISKTMGRRTAALYLGSIIAGAVLFGLLIDLALPASWFMLPGAGCAGCHHALADMHWFPAACSLLLVGLLAWSFINRRNHHHHHTHNSTAMEYRIKGMACQHCRATVEKGLASLPGVTKVSVDLSTGIATVEGEVAPEAVAAKVRSLGFDLPTAP